jgi:hypothetical protein
MVGSATTKFGALKPVNDILSVLTLKDEYIYQTLGISPWVLNIFFGYHRLRCLAASEKTVHPPSNPTCTKNGSCSHSIRETVAPICYSHSRWTSLLLWHDH